MKKPKIDINSLRIEAREDDLSPNYNIRTYYVFEYTLRDDNRVFKVGSLEEVFNFLFEKFGIRFSGSLRYSFGNFPTTIYLKDVLTKHITGYAESNYCGRELVGI